MQARVTRSPCSTSMTSETSRTCLSRENNRNRTYKKRPILMSHFNENAMEMGIMELFEQQGYSYKSGETINKNYQKCCCVMT